MSKNGQGKLCLASTYRIRKKKSKQVFVWFGHSPQPYSFPLKSDVLNAGDQNDQGSYRGEH